MARFLAGPRERKGDRRRFGCPSRRQLQCEVALAAADIVVGQLDLQADALARHRQRHNRLARRRRHRESRHDRELAHHVAVRELGFAAHHRHADPDRNVVDAVFGLRHKRRIRPRTVPRLFVEKRVAILHDRCAREIGPREGRTVGNGDVQRLGDVLIAVECC